MAVVSSGGTPELMRNSPHEALPSVTVEPSLPASNAYYCKAKAMIAFSATGESWLKVTDAKGVVVPGRTLRTSQSAEASGALPLVAVVGRADVI